MEQLLKEIREEMLHMFDHLHTHPELSWKEYNTTTYLKELLENAGARVQIFSDCTGVIAEIGEGSPVVALRADIDALWQEVDGENRANHSCGHDAHMTMVYGAFLLLKKLHIGKGTVRFIFQPAEEKGNGALKMVEKKVADDIDYLYGVHLRPIQDMENGKAAPAMFHGASRFLLGKVSGEDMHGARPHLGANAIEVGATFVQMLNQIQINPLIPHSAKVTSFQAGGESFNIIPGSAVFSIDLRAQTNEGMEELQQKVEAAGRTLSSFYNVGVSVDIVSSIVAAQVNPEAEAIMRDAIVDVLGPDKLLDSVTTTGGDDFHFYTVKRPSIKATMLALGCDLSPGLHHPNMTFDKEAIFSGIGILTRVVLRTFEQNPRD